MNATVAWVSSRYEGILEFRRLINGYRRFDPSRGLDYKLDIAFQDTTSGHEIHKRFCFLCLVDFLSMLFPNSEYLYVMALCRLEVSKPLGRVEVVPVPYVTENTRVCLVLPVTVDTKAMVAEFIKQYNSICMEKKDKTFLMLVGMETITLVSYQHVVVFSYN